MEQVNTSIHSIFENLMQVRLGVVVGSGVDPGIHSIFENLMQVRLRVVVEGGGRPACTASSRTSCNSG